jgi:hypothetical protein
MKTSSQGQGILDLRTTLDTVVDYLTKRTKFMVMFVVTHLELSTRIKATAKSNPLERNAKIPDLR